MPNRKFSGTSEYRYGFNGQENSDEIAAGLTTAMYWEYDSRIGRRWNIDPIEKVDESPYSCFSGNPILFSDPSGLDSEDPAKHTVKKGETLTSIASDNKIDLKELLYINKQIKNPDKIKIGQEINLPLSVAYNTLSNVESSIFPNMNRKEFGKLAEQNFGLSSNEAMEMRLAIVEQKTKDIISNSPRLLANEKALDAQASSRESSSSKFRRQIADPMKLTAMKGVLIASASGLSILGAEAFPVIGEAITEKSIEAYVVTNMMLNHLRRKAIMGIVELAVVKYGKDALYKKELWNLAGAAKEMKNILTPQNIAKLVKQIDKIMKKIN